MKDQPIEILVREIHESNTLVAVHCKAIARRLGAKLNTVPTAIEMAGEWNAAKKNRQNLKRTWGARRGGRIGVTGNLAESTVRDRLINFRLSKLRAATANLPSVKNHDFYFFRAEESNPACAELNQIDTFEPSGKWPELSRITNVTFAKDWLTSVYKRDLSRVDDMPTLAAVALDFRGHEAYSAAWIVNSRGCKLLVETGYIVKAHGQVAHSTKSCAEALRNCLKKSDAQHRKNATELDILCGAIKNKKVTMANARSTGACESGIRDWCAKFSVTITKNTAETSEVLRAYSISRSALSLRVLAAAL